MNAPHGRPGTPGKRQLSVLQIQQQQQLRQQQQRQQNRQTRERYGISPMVNASAVHSNDVEYDFSMSDATSSAIEKAATVKPPPINSSKKAPAHARRKASDPLQLQPPTPTATHLRRNLNHTRKRQADDPLGQALQRQGQRNGGGGDVFAAAAVPSKYRHQRGAARSSSSAGFHFPGDCGRDQRSLQQQQNLLHESRRQKVQGPLSTFATNAIADPHGFKTTDTESKATATQRSSSTMSAQPTTAHADTSNRRRRRHSPSTPLPSSVAGTVDSFSSGNISVTRKLDGSTATSQESSHNPLQKRIPRKAKNKKDVVDLCDGDGSDTDDGDAKSDQTHATIRQRPKNMDSAGGSSSSSIKTHPGSSKASLPASVATLRREDGARGSLSSHDEPELDASRHDDDATIAAATAPAADASTKSSPFKYTTPMSHAVTTLHQSTSDKSWETPAAAASLHPTNTRSSGTSHLDNAFDSDDSNGQKDSFVAKQQKRTPGFGSNAATRTAKLHGSDCASIPNRKRSNDVVDIDDYEDVNIDDPDQNSTLFAPAEVPRKKNTKSTANPKDDALVDSDDEDITHWCSKPKATKNESSEEVTAMLNDIQSEPYAGSGAADHAYVDDRATSPGVRKNGSLFKTCGIDVRAARELSSPKKKRKAASAIIPGAAIKGFATSRDEKKQSALSTYDQPKERAKLSSTGPTTRSKSSSTEKSAPPFQSRRLTRQSSRKSNGSVIEIESSDEDELTPSKPKSSGTATAGVIRVAFGKKIFHSGCTATFALNNCSLTITYKKAAKRSYRFTVNSTPDDTEAQMIDLEEALAVKFFVNKLNGDADEGAEDDMDVTSFLAVGVEPNDDNGLSRFPNMYQPKGDDLYKKFIVLEFRSEKEFEAMRELMLEHATLRVYLTEGSKLSPHEAKDYCKALQADSDKEKRRRGSSSASEPMSTFLVGKGPNEVLLVYPFDGDAADIDRAAEGFAELSAPATDAAVADAEDGEDEDEEEQEQKISAEPSSEKENAGENVGENATSTTKEVWEGGLQLTTSTFERLDHGVYLNDTLIDFWCRWTLRNVNKATIHLFTTHFYTTLEDSGAESVANWTKKRGVDVFSKKFVIIPINKSLHWSVCIVVNPGAIADHAMTISDGVRQSDDDRLPCLLFFDSLKAHASQKVATNVRKWLNAEWQRSGPDRKNSSPFIPTTMKIYSPRVPYQDNTWDCGVYLCRYVFAMYKLRGRRFSYRDAGLVGEKQQPFKVLITDSDEFEFGTDDISRIRNEFRTLLERLSVLYVKWKAEEDDKRRKAIAARKKKAQEEKLRNEMPTDGEPEDGKLKDSSNAFTEGDKAVGARNQAEAGSGNFVAEKQEQGLQSCEVARLEEAPPDTAVDSGSTNDREL